MWKTIGLVLLFLFGSGSVGWSLQAQAGEATLTIRVLDAADRSPLVGVQVALDPCACGGITDETGTFSMVLSRRKYEVELFYLGFKGVQRPVDLTNSVTLELLMEEAVEQLSEVVLRARRISQNLESPQMGALQLEVQEIKKIPMATGEFDVLRGMTLLPGVNNAGEVSNGLSVRGGSLDQNLMLFDYAPVFNPTHLFGLYSVFTPEVISQVDLYRANIPARYGGRVSSVLDVKSKNPYPDSFKLQGGVGLVSTRLAVETPLIANKLNISAGARAGYTDFLLPLFSERLKDTRAQFHDATLKLLWLAGRDDQIFLSGFHSYDFYQLDLISQVEDINAKNNQYEFRTINGTLGWTHAVNDKTSLRNILVVSDYRPGNYFPEQNSPNKIQYKSGIRYYSYLSEIVQFLSDKLDWYAGIQGIRYEVDPGQLDPGSGNSINPVQLEQERSYEFAAYGNLNTHLSDGLNLSVGLRANHYVLVGPFTEPVIDPLTGNLLATTVFDKGAGVKTYNSIEPRLGINYSLGEHSALKASYARLNQYLQNIYNSSTPLPTSRWKTADPLIKPQRSDAFALGFVQGFNEDAIELSVEAYYRTSRNNLTYKAGADFFLEPYLQREVIQGEGKAYGVEFGFRKPEGKVNGWLNYTYSRSFNRSQSEALAGRINNNNWYPSEFDRPHVLNGTVNFEGDTYNTWSFNLTVQSGRPFTAPNAVFQYQDIDIPIFIERNNVRLKPYHRLDFSWNVRYGKKLNRRWVGDWIFTIYNVYGRRNPFSRYYSQRQGSENSDIFLDSPLGSYELSVINSPIFAITYNFTFD